SLCFAICRRRRESLPHTGASTTTAAGCIPSPTARSIMVAPSTFTPPTSSANSGLIGASTGARRRCSGSKPGGSTPSATGATLICGQCIACPITCRSGWRASSGGEECRILFIRGLPRPWMRWRGRLRHGSGTTLGWSVILSTTNCLGGRGWSTDPREYYALAINTLALGPESSAKSVLAAQLIEAYREPEHLAQGWGTPLASWDELRSAGFVLPPASFDNPAVIRDLAAFTRRFAEAYFRTVAEALRHHDPDHLYLGSRFAWRTPEAVEACAHWCDVVSFNLYKPS